MPPPQREDAPPPDAIPIGTDSEEEFEDELAHHLGRTVREAPELEELGRWTDDGSHDPRAARALAGDIEAALRSGDPAGAGARLLWMCLPCHARSDLQPLAVSLRMGSALRPA